MAAPQKIISQSYDVPKLSELLDYIHIMSYDYHGKWDRVTGHNAPITGETLSVVSSGAGGGAKDGCVLGRGGAERGEGDMDSVWVVVFNRAQMLW